MPLTSFSTPLVQKHLTLTVKTQVVCVLMCQGATKNRDFLTDRPHMNKITQTLSNYIHRPFCTQCATLSNATIDTRKSHDHNSICNYVMESLCSRPRVSSSLSLKVMNFVSWFMQQHVRDHASCFLRVCSPRYTPLFTRALSNFTLQTLSVVGWK